MSDSFINTVRQVIQGSGHAITVEPCPDGTRSIRIRTADKQDREYFGAADILVPTDFARNLAAAIEVCADEVDMAQDKGKTA